MVTFRATTIHSTHSLWMNEWCVRPRFCTVRLYCRIWPKTPLIHSLSFMVFIPRFLPRYHHSNFSTAKPDSNTSDLHAVLNGHYWAGDNLGEWDEVSLLWIMPLEQDRSLDLLASSPACYHCTTDAPHSFTIIRLIWHYSFVEYVNND